MSEELSQNFNFNSNTEFYLMPLRDIVIYPNMIIPLFVGRSFSIRAIEEAFKRDKIMFFVLQKDRYNEEPSKKEDYYEIGTIVKLLRVVPLEDSRLKILVQGISKGKVLDVIKKEDYYTALVSPIEDKEILIDSLDLNDKAYVNSIKDIVEKLIALGKQIIPDLISIIRETEELNKFLDLVASILDIKPAQAQELLETIDPKEKLKKIYNLLVYELGLLEIQNKIKQEARQKMEKEQRDYFLRQQMKAIQEELGEEDDKKSEIEEYIKKLEELKLSEEIKKDIEKQIKRLQKLYSDSAEAGVLRTWLDWVIELPWNVKTKDRFDVEKAKKILDKDHYDLEEIKERIIEYLSVRKLTRGKNKKSPIICFIGPPGVGKTSLGQSIAKATNRKFIRISLGGVRDEAEIRGHRRTYVGAMPGRIIQAIKQAGVKNPVIMLDEIDKLAISFQGDPAAALLEVLDPEQNKNFVDHYIGHPFDLSEIIFIATGNRSDTIPPPLLDRMEIINLSGYSEEEKLQIAKSYILPNVIKEHGFKEKEINISDEALLTIIREYTREAGVRNLQKMLSSILRKFAVLKLKKNKKIFSLKSKEEVRKLLGPPKILREKEEKALIGVATGLAWTEVGGEIMYIEATKSKGKGALMLTGSLGDVMKESAQAALSFIKSNSEKYNINPEIFQEVDIHIHVPAGAVPKDGPSAGVAISVALLSLFTSKPVRMDIAMTGEISLRGRVLPVGGLKEKILAAKREEIYEIILPLKNKDEVLKELPNNVQKQLKLHFVSYLDEAFDIVFKDDIKR